MTRKRRILGLVAAVAALCLTAGGARSQHTGRGDQTEEFHQTYQLAPGGRVRLENINGDVRVRAWDQNAVKVDAVKYAHAPERLREAEIVVTTDAQGVRVRTRYQSESLTWNHGDARVVRNNPASVDYVLTVPRNVRIDRIELVNGGLDIEGLDGEVSASSVNGRVAARALSGPVKLSTVNGPLEASFERLGPNLDLGSVNGPLTLTLPSDANAEVRASTVHGGISNDVGLPVKHGKYVGHNLAGRFGAGATRVRLDNVNGPIRLRRAQDGRSASPVVNLLLETATGGGDDWEDVNQQVEREVREALKETERERREALKEAARERAQERMERERERAQNDREREQERIEARRERDRERQQEMQEQQRERQEKLREAQREREEALREAAEERRRLQEEARVITRDAARVSRDVAREIGRGVRVDVDGDDRRQIERVSNTFQAAGSPRVRVSNFDGPVTVIAWDKPEVMYTAVKRAHDEREMQGIKIDANVASSTRTGQGASATSDIVITASFDKARAHRIETRGERIVSIGSDASVEFDLYVPRNSALTLNTADGRLRVDGVQGDMELHTGDGGIDLSNGRGRLRAQTGDGRIRVVDFNGEVSAQTGDGRIMLEGDFSQLSARTGDGSISLAIPDGTNAFIDTDAETVNSDGMAVAEDGAGTPGGLRRWKVGSGGRVYTLRTGDGQIILRRR